MTKYSLKTETVTLALSLKFWQQIIITHDHCVTLYQNLSINKATFFLNSNCDLDFGPTMLKCQLIQDIIILTFV